MVNIIENNALRKFSFIFLLNVFIYYLFFSYNNVDFKF